MQRKLFADFRAIVPFLDDVSASRTWMMSPGDPQKGNMKRASETLAYSIDNNSFSTAGARRIK